MDRVGKVVLGHKIRTARQHRNMSAETLADKAGITKEYIDNIECGKDSPGFQSLLNIANALETSMNYLLDENLKYNVLSQKVSEGDMRDNLLQQINTLTLKQQESVAKFIAIIKEYKD